MLRNCRKIPDTSWLVYFSDCTVQKPRRSPQRLRFLYCILEEISCTICISCFLLFLNLGRQKKNTSDKGVFSKKARDFVQKQINTKILCQNCANLRQPLITLRGEPHPACQLWNSVGFLSSAAFCPPYRACCQQLHVTVSLLASCSVFTEFVLSVLSKIFTSNVHDVRFCDVCLRGSRNSSWNHM